MKKKGLETGDEEGEAKKASRLQPAEQVVGGGGHAARKQQAQWLWCDTVPDEVTASGAREAAAASGCRFWFSSSWGSPKQEF